MTTPMPMQAADPDRILRDCLWMPDEFQKHPFVLDTTEDTLRRLAGIIDVVVKANAGGDLRGDLVGADDETELLLTEVAGVAVRLAKHMEQARKRAGPISRGAASRSLTDRELESA